MNAYETYLVKSRHRLKGKGFWTYLILLLSRWTSDYGQSVTRPFITFSIFNFGLFMGLVYSKGEPGLVFVPGFSYQQVIVTIGKAIRFANPLRKYEMDLEGWPVILDMLMRIISSYCIYNIIRATRRFVK